MWRRSSWACARGASDRRRVRGRFRRSRLAAPGGFQSSCSGSGWKGGCKMASVSSDANGCKRIFVMIEGCRKVIRVGRMEKEDAKAFGRKVERLISLRRHGEPVDDDLRSWVYGLGDEV